MVNISRLHKYFIFFILSFYYSCQSQSPVKQEKKTCLPLRTHQHESRLCPTMGEFAPSELKKKEKFLQTELLLYQTLSPQTRGTIELNQKDALQLCFKIKKNQQQVSLLASGRERRQVGIKLKAQDSCNTLYVMWHFFPRFEMVISEKINSSQHVHQQCGNKGYHVLKRLPLEHLTNSILPPLNELNDADRFYLLQARLDPHSQHLSVYLNYQLLWTGPVHQQWGHISAPVGLRTDNMQIDFAVEEFQLNQSFCPI